MRSAMTPLLSNAATAPYRLRAFAHVTRPCRHCIHTAAWAPLPWRNPQHLQRPHRPQRSARPLLSLRPHCSAVAAEAPPSAAAAAPTVAKVDQLDYTALAACAHELREAWLPSKVESVVMADETTLALCLRSVARTGWLHVSWHPVAARVCVGEQPERGEASEAFPLGALVNAKCASTHHSVCMPPSTVQRTPIPFSAAQHLSAGAWDGSRFAPAATARAVPQRARNAGFAARC